MSNEERKEPPPGVQRNQLRDRLRAQERTIERLVQEQNKAEALLFELERAIENCVDDPEELPLAILERIKAYFGRTL